MSLVPRQPGDSAATAAVARNRDDARELAGEQLGVHKLQANRLRLIMIGALNWLEQLGMDERAAAPEKRQRPL